MTCKIYNDCTEEEKAAVDKWYTESHSSNFPYNKSAAVWRFYKDRHQVTRAVLVSENHTELYKGISDNLVRNSFYGKLPPK